MTTFAEDRRVTVQAVHPAVWVALAILGAAACWATFAVLGGNTLQHPDTLEAYAWGREFQLGYYKHPPLWAWVAGLWFKLWPRTDWAFFFLSEINAGLGVLGAWMLIGRFVRGPARDAGALLLLLTTFYSFNALRFNANTFPLSIWPWTMFFFIRSIERRTLAAGALFGLFAGFALLTKYYAGFLLLTCAVAALVHEDRKAYLASRAPWVAILVFGLVIAPHVLWLMRDGYLPILYMLGQIEPVQKFRDTALGFALACVAYHLVQAALLAFVRWRGGRAPALQIDHGLPFLSILALGPFALTVCAGAFAHARLAPLYAVPIFSLTPFLLLVLVRPRADVVAALAARLYIVLLVACLIAAPFIGYFSLRLHPERDHEPVREIAAMAERAWANHVGRPVHIVAGTWPYGTAATFYLPGDVSQFTAFNYRWAPWITPERIRREGLLYICAVDRPNCIRRAGPWRAQATEIAMTASRHFLGAAGEPVRFIVGIVPPQQP